MNDENLRAGLADMLASMSAIAGILIARQLTTPEELAAVKAGCLAEIDQYTAKIREDYLSTPEGKALSKAQETFEQLLGPHFSRQQP